MMSDIHADALRENLQKCQRTELVSNSLFRLLHGESRGNSGTDEEDGNNRNEIIHVTVEDQYCSILKIQTANCYLAMAKKVRRRLVERLAGSEGPTVIGKVDMKDNVCVGEEALCDQITEFANSFLYIQHP